MKGLLYVALHVAYKISKHKQRYSEFCPVISLDLFVLSYDLKLYMITVLWNVCCTIIYALEGKMVQVAVS